MSEFTNSKLQEMPLHVFGRVVYANGDAVAEKTVKVVSRNITDDELLDTATTGADGTYSIRLPNISVGALVVAAYASPSDPPMVESPVLFNASGSLQVDLVFDHATNGEYVGKSEFQQITDAIGGTVDFKELTNDQIKLAAGTATILPERVAYRTAAAKHVNALSGDGTVNPQVLYALFRHHIGASLDFLGKNPDAIRAALESASDSNIVDPLSDAAIDAEMNNLRLILRKRLLVDLEPSDPKVSSLKKLLNAVPLDETEQSDILTSYLASTNPAAFWSSVASTYGTTKTTQLQFTLQVGALSGNKTWMATHLRSLLGTGTGQVANFRALAAWNTSDWREAIDNAAEPAGFDTFSLPATERDAYARQMRAIVEDALPTTVIGHRTAAHDVDVSAFLLDADNADFDFHNTVIRHYFEENDIDDPELQARLEAYQRVVRLAPSTLEFRADGKDHERYDVVKRFIDDLDDVDVDDDVTSAAAITRMGRAVFRSRYASTPAIADAADAIYDRASYATSSALAVLTRHHPALRGPSLPVLRTQPAEGSEEYPFYSALFGTASYCTCKDCCSVLSPAAYLADILHFLERRPKRTPEGATVVGGGTMLGLLTNAVRDPDDHVLRVRREDIEQIELSCDNTNVTLPYIDLVNEVLEFDVVTGTLSTEADPPAEATYARQTTKPSEELKWAPEHSTMGAYSTLRSSDRAYPLSLPFDRWREEERTHLGHIGMQRSEVMQAAVLDFNVNVAAEEVGLSRGELAILMPTGTFTPTAAQWGLTGSDWVTKLTNVATMLRQSGLTLDELRSVLASRYVNPMHETKQLRLVEVDPCDVGTWSIAYTDSTAIDANLFGRIYRFLRVRNRSGFTSAELDAAFNSLGTDITNSHLRKLAQLIRLRREIGRPYLEMMCWSQAQLFSMEWCNEPSLFERVFETPAAKVETDGSALLNGPQSAKVAAALGIDIDELKIAADAESLTVLNPAALESLFRRVSMARALGMSIRGFQRWIDATGTSITTLYNPDDVITLVKSVRRDAAFGIGAAELDYLLRDNKVPSESVAPTDQEISTALVRASMAIAQLPDAPQAHEGAVSDEDIYRNLSGILGEINAGEAVPNALAKRIVDLLRNASTWETNDRKFVFRYFSRVFQTDILGAIEFLGGSADDPQTIQPQADVQKRFAYFLSYLIPYTTKLRAAVNAVRPLLPCSEAAATYLLEWGLQTDLGGATYEGESAIFTVFDILVSLLEPSADPEESPPYSEENPPLRDDENSPLGLFDAAHKAALLVARLRFIPREIDSVFANGSWEYFDPHNPFAVPTNAHLQSLIEATSLKNEIVGPTETFFDLIDAAVAGSGDLAEWKATIVERTRWSDEDLAWMFDHLGVSYPDTFVGPDVYAAVAPIMLAARRIGVSARNLIELFGATESDASAETRAVAIRSAIRSRYTAASWPSVATDLTNVMRQKQRDAMVAYLVARDRLDNVEQLFSRLLIDTQMAPCQQTSRLKAAIGSVQTFVQRALLQLEPGAYLNDDDAAEWSWMKSYRVWEANRKVFLYPENFLDPELRDNKTDSFVEFEKMLRQNEAEGDIVEDAFHSYAVSLADIARLDVVGCTQDDHDVFHVFARTRSAPYRYFYRTFSRVKGWSGWEKVGVEIAGEQITPVFFNSQIYVSWVQWARKGEEQQGREGPPASSWTMQLAFARMRNGKWSAPMISDSTTLQYELANNPGEPFARTSEDGGDLVVDVWVRISEDVHPARYTGTPSDYLRLRRFRIVDGVGPIVIDSELRYAESGALAVPRWTVAQGRGALQVVNDGDNGVWLPHIDPTGVVDESMVLEKTPGDLPYTIIVPPQSLHYTAQTPGFYQDHDRAFFIEPTVAPSKDDLRASLADPTRTGFRQIPRLAAAIEATGIAGLAPTELRRSELGRPLYGTTVLENSPFFGRPSSSKSVPPISTGIALAVGHGTAGSSTPPPSAMAKARNTTGIDVSDAVAGIRAEIDAVAPVWPHFPNVSYRFSPFEFPYATEVVRALNRGGTKALFAPKDADDDLTRQQGSNEFFDAAYQPSDRVLEPYPRDEFDFSASGSYSPYNWELFFHAPFLVAEKLRANRQYEDSFRWLRFIFDPRDTTGGDPASAWRVKPFHEEAGSHPIDQLMKLLDIGEPSDPEMHRERDELELQVQAMRTAPFHPHAIARLRPEAYQKAVIMKMLDVLIEWGDGLFAQDTIETINEATQLYILAALIIGPRPFAIDHDREGGDKSYAALNLDDFSNALVSVETLLPAPSNRTPGATSTDIVHPIVGPSLYFCVPVNDKLFGYWDTVADRLFKIRHCQNLQGITRELPLFEPPIDPALLVRAVAAGVDLRTALSGINATRPLYRFNVMVQKAMELANEVRSLGGALLAALEKRDAEHLATMRSGQEIDLLAMVRQVREAQLDEAKAAVDALTASQEIAAARQTYYENLISRGLSGNERTQLDSMSQAFLCQTLAQASGAVGSVVAMIPDFGIGAVAIAPEAMTTFGGSNVAKMFEFLSQGLQFDASFAQHLGAVAALNGTYERRSEEWRFQADAAKRDQAQIERQKVAAEIRVQIATKELANHDKQVANATEADAFMRSKFSNEELYDWMVRELTATHDAAYRLAHSVAKKAQSTFAHEIGPGSDPDFIRSDYWNSTEKGLLAGDKLAHDLRRMEVAYLDANVREHEMVKHISLASLDPVALVQLKETGKCSVSIPEVIFDLDQPGHYFRRIKSVAVTVPCVTGPYTGVHCKLTLGESRIRTDASATGTYDETPHADHRFTYLTGHAESVVTSSGQSDSGLFEANLRDERYLPFEGAGAIGHWTIELPAKLPQFDFESITDVVLTMRYTARFDEALKTTASNAIQGLIDHLVSTVGTSSEGLMRAFSMRQEFSGDWHRFLFEPASGVHTLSIPLSKSQLPFEARNKTVSIKRATLFLVPIDSVAIPPSPDSGLSVAATFTPDDVTAISTNLTQAKIDGERAFDNALWVKLPTSGDLGGTLDGDPWTLTIADSALPTDLKTSGVLDPTKVKDLVLVIQYGIA